MTSDYWLERSLIELAYQSPLLVAYLVGLVVALSRIGRYRRPAVLAASAFAILLVSAVAQTLAVQYVVSNIRDGWSNIQVAEAIRVTGIAGTVVRTVAFGLLIAAVFAGRTPAPRPDGD